MTCVTRLFKQSQILVERFQDSDLSKADILQLTREIDPYLWNFVLLLTQRRAEKSEMLKSNVTTLP